MNKTEKAEMERLRHDLALSRALRWPSYPSPSPMTRDDIEASKCDVVARFGTSSKVARGYFANVHSIRVDKGWSDGFRHGYSDNSSTQGMGRLFRTDVEAWQYLRHEVTVRYAGELAFIDRMIAEAEGGTDGI
ncbi:hypothetical protein Oant_1522 [Brucella anthropi ATCC 49188]|uniref:Uncharacterized protein n=2 Tax=Brucella anthropi TaxID=529 RepID=A6WZ34_BRUA4|nr:hypothetical protein Oant_1522 [Brucella anthropi ATCC 49188]